MDIVNLASKCLKKGTGYSVSRGRPIELKNANVTGIGRGEISDADEGLFGGCGGVQAGGRGREERSPCEADGKRSRRHFGT